MISFVAILIGTFLSAIAADNGNPFAPPDFPPPKFKEARYDVKDFGARGDGLANDTKAINAAIETCSAAGGGNVVFPPGKFAAASIRIRSNVRLLLDTNTVIFGAPTGFDAPEPNPFDPYQDFGHSHFRNSLLWGENVENFAIVGGKINGGSIIRGDPKPGGGDKLITIKVGRSLQFEGITHEQGGHFIYLLNDCENVTIANITILDSRDGVDLMGCRNVQIHDCRFTGCGDDTIGIKSDYALGRRIASANIYVWDSHFESGCNALQFGSETAGDFHNISFWNITIGRAGKAGIGITSNDGGIISDVRYRDISIKGASCPIFMLISDRLRTGGPNPRIGTIRNVTLSNITISDCRPGQQNKTFTSTISGYPGACLTNIVLENVRMTCKGGGTLELTNAAPPYPKGNAYSPRHLGTRPASGFYIRHVRGLTFKNVEMAFETEDQRPLLAVLDVDGFLLDGFRAQKPAGMETIRMERVKHFTVRNSPGFADRTTVVVDQGGE